MAFELIPLPLSILFIVVLISAYLAVLWKLRKRGKMYLALFSLAIVLLMAVLASVAYQYAEPPAPVKEGAGPVEIEIASQIKATYSPSEQFRLQIYVDNPHDWAVPYPLSVTFSLPPVGDFSNVPANINVKYPPLPAHSKTLFSSPTIWAPTIPGNYTLTISLQGSVNYGQPVKCSIVVEPAK
jgi:hypothetical protein